MPHPSDPTESFSSASRFRIALNVALALLALAALLGMANYLAARHFRRFLWAEDERYQLSLPTRQVLAAITNEVKVTILFSRDNTLHSPVTGLLKEYGYACPRLRIETIDYDRDVQLAQTTAARLQLSPEDSDLVVFEREGRTRIVRAVELSEYDISGLLAGGKEVRRVGFKGESLFTDALASLIEGRSPKVYFLQGHGEHDPTSIETRFGYSQFTRLLQQKNIATATLRLVGDAEVPEDCELLVLAGPRSRIDPTALEKIGRYLDTGGRMLALLSFYQSGYAQTGLERFLAGWGVAVGDDLALDPSNAVRGGGILATNFSNHPIVRPMRGHTVYLLVPRSVAPLRVGGAAGDAPKVEPLVSTSVGGRTESEGLSSGLPEFNPARDQRGVIPLAVAVEKGSIQGVAADRNSTRLVVVGESIFLANETIMKSAANIEFASLAVNWLLDRPQHLSGLAPRPIKEHSVLLSQSQVVQLRWILLAVLPGTPLLIGLLVWWRRRR
ncbi:MAG TPA: GldG family protein [Verrucomicrobiota bacterium]|nr:GldG family protein [Verrucomicrobiota bacterium]